MEKLPKDLEWVDVRSTNVKSVAHKDGKLYVAFVSGRTGVYTGVPREVYRRMIRAASKGKFVHRVLKAGYAYQEL
jgi:hypothetical protein